MRRTFIALLAVAGTTIPALVATVWLFGCCVLPFHNVVHRLLPMCRASMAILQGSRDHSEKPATAPPAKQGRPERIAPEPTSRASFAVASLSSAVVSSTPAAYRSAITLGAVRCDDDIGLSTLLSILLI